MTTAALIYAPSITPRLQYLADFLSQYFALPFQLTDSEAIYLDHSDACKINYSNRSITSSELHIGPHALLFESVICPQQTMCFDAGAYTAFFKTECPLGFDLFAAIFFLITRYEEYLPFQKDFYGRYAHQNALAYQNNFLHLPLVDIWLKDFKKLLAEKNTDFGTTKNKFTFIPTYDIDIAWAYKNKGFLKNMAALAYTFCTGKLQMTRERFLVLTNKRPDPYDCYQWLDELHQSYHLHPLYFLLMAMKKGKYDKNIDVKNNEYRKLVQSISNNYTVGLHPSWASSEQGELLQMEKDLLENSIGKCVSISRQHYIRLKMPVTYRQLIVAGFTADHSMGYGDINGFRASVCRPFYWYDLQKEQPTNLLIQPFCFMDANAYYEQKLTPEQTFHQLCQFRNIIHSLQGTMVTIWHNHFLGTGQAFIEWKQVYERFVATIHND